MSFLTSDKHSQVSVKPTGGATEAFARNRYDTSSSVPAGRSPTVTGPNQTKPHVDEISFISLFSAPVVSRFSFAGHLAKEFYLLKVVFSVLLCAQNRALAVETRSDDVISQSWPMNYASLTVVWENWVSHLVEFGELLVGNVQNDSAGNYFIQALQQMTELLYDS